VKLKVGRSYHYKEKPDEYITVFERITNGAGDIVVGAKPTGRAPKGNYATFFIEGSRKLTPCEDFNICALGLITLFEVGRISLEDAGRVLIDDFGVHLFTSSADDFIKDLTALIQPVHERNK